MKRFFVDAETDGLYGAFLSVAALVTDENGKEIDHLYGALHPDAIHISEPWVEKNVLPFLNQADIFFKNEAELLDSFWSFWIKHREGAECIADVGYPVEATLFSKCVCKDLSKRMYLGPFPLYDLRSLLKARGYDPLEPRANLVSNKLNAHDAMNDVRMMEEIWRKLL